MAEIDNPLKQNETPKLVGRVDGVLIYADENSLPTLSGGGSADELVDDLGINRRELYHLLKQQNPELFSKTEF